MSVCLQFRMCICKISKLKLLKNLEEANTHILDTHAHVICHVHLLRANDKTAKQSRIPDYVCICTYIVYNAQISAKLTHRHTWVRVLQFDLICLRLCVCVFM